MRKGFYGGAVNLISSVPCGRPCHCLFVNADNYDRHEKIYGYAGIPENTMVEENTTT